MLKAYSVLSEEKKDGDGGGGSGKDSKSTDDSKTLADLTAQNAALIARLEKLEAGSKKQDDPSKDADLSIKAREQRDAEAKKATDAKALEAALKFSLKSDDFLKTNQSLLPKDIESIFKAAEKETYSNAIEKDAAIKAGIIKSFFSIEDNMQLLTPAVKESLEAYFKLTNTGKQEKAQLIYDTIFEPAFEMLRRIKKAEAVGKGFNPGSSSEDAYKNKMISLSKKHYLGEKSNA